jgi:hypothetical protein
MQATPWEGLLRSTDGKRDVARVVPFPPSTGTAKPEVILHKRFKQIGHTPFRPISYYRIGPPAHTADRRDSSPRQAPFWMPATDHLDRDRRFMARRAARGIR